MKTETVAAISLIIAPVAFVIIVGLLRGYHFTLWRPLHPDRRRRSITITGDPPPSDPET